jgi:regulator of nonsense transcripts 1
MLEFIREQRGSLASKNSSSLRNPEEARLARDILKAMLRAYPEEMSRMSIGVITPYRKQEEELKNILNLFGPKTRESTGTSSNKSNLSTSGDGAKKASSSNIPLAHSLADLDIEIATVDAFQGREKDIILFSCVRSQGKSI